MHQNIRDICGKKSNLSSGYTKSKSGTVLFEREDIKKRWEEYIGELYADEKIEDCIIHKNLDGPPILKAEIENAMRRLRNGKSAGSNSITTEMLGALGEYGVEILTKLINKMYDNRKSSRHAKICQI